MYTCTKIYIHGCVLLDSGGAKIEDLQLVNLVAYSSGKEVVSGGTVVSPSFTELRL